MCIFIIINKTYYINILGLVLYLEYLRTNNETCTLVVVIVFLIHVLRKSFHSYYTVQFN